MSEPSNADVNTNAPPEMVVLPCFIRAKRPGCAMYDTYFAAEDVCRALDVAGVKYTLYKHQHSKPRGGGG